MDDWHYALGMAGGLAAWGLLKLRKPRPKPVGLLSRVLMHWNDEDEYLVRDFL
jgi:hypothetical protein